MKHKIFILFFWVCFCACRFPLVNQSSLSGVSESLNVVMMRGGLN